MRRDVPPPGGGDGEKTTLVAFLDYLREAVVRDVEGVPEPQARAAGVASGTSLLGLVKHLTAVERFYFLGEPITDLRRTLRPTAGETAEGLVVGYREAVGAANAVVGEWADLSAPAPRAPGRPAAPSRRWVLVHMIEETGRHAGHADILREQIDGATGR